MPITAGDVIVVGIVLVVLAVYRQIDRNNRSLEKVKRFADKVQGDIDHLVAERVTALRDVAIEVDVNQKASREILKRISQAEQELTDRAANVETIAERIQKYESALQELDALTNAAHENIKRVQDESEYIDGVGKRIKSSARSISELEERLSTAEQRFAEENSTRLSQAQAELVRDGEARVAQLSDMAEQAEQRMQGVASKLERSFSSLDDRAATVLTSAEERLANLEKTGVNLETTALAKLKAFIEQQTREAAATLKAFIQSESTGMREQLEQQLGDRSSEIGKELDARISNMEEDLAERIASVGERMQRMSSSIEETEGETERRLRELFRSTTESVAQWKTQLHGRIETLKTDVTGSIETLEQEQSRFVNAETRLQASIVEVADRIAQSDEEQKGRISELELQWKRAFARKASEVEQSMFDRFDQELSQITDTLQSRLERVEAVGGDVENLESALRETIRLSGERLDESLGRLGEELHGKREQDLEQAQEEMGRIHTELEALDRTVAQLKSTAYENVSEKLKVFEDDFFKDLRTRSSEMDARLESWKSSIDAELARMAEDSTQAREDLELQYHKDLERSLETHRATTKKILDEQQEQLHARVKELTTHTDAMKHDLEAFKEDHARRFEDTLQKHDVRFTEQLDEKFEVLRARLQEQTEAFEQSLSTAEQHTSGELQEIGARIAETDQRVKNMATQLTELVGNTEREVSDRLSRTRATAQETIAALDDEMAVRYADLGNRAAEIDGRIVTVGERIDARSQQAIERFDEQAQSFKSDIERHTRQLEDAAEQQLRDLRSVTRETREDFEDQRTSLIGRVESEARVLQSQLDDISEAQKQFIEQTRLFDRADELKDELAQNLGRLKADLDSVYERRETVERLDAEVSAVRNLVEDTQSRLTVFMNEKRRIDSIEEDYARLLNLSDQVESKLSQVTGSSDMLQDLQLRLRTVEDLREKVDAGLNRLEKKQQVIKATADGVDSSFNRLEDLERRIVAMREDVDGLPRQLADISQTIRELSDNKADADIAVAQMRELTGMLTEVEGRMLELQKAREWLARTETRLEEIGREAKDQVKLLGDIMKRDKSSGGKDSGAPPASVRDTVAKLAHQGWQPDEIARATRLSLGEVELILEMPKR
ncbi:MAG: SpiroCoCo family coiled-coil protein [Spirochaetota bacterium]